MGPGGAGPGPTACGAGPGGVRGPPRAGACRSGRPRAAWPGPAPRPAGPAPPRAPGGPCTSRERPGAAGEAGPAAGQGRGGAEARPEREPKRGGRGGRGGGLRPAKMASVGLQFQASAGDADPQSRPLLLLGQLHHLHRVPWSHVRGKLLPRVTEEVSGPRRPPCAALPASGGRAGPGRPGGRGGPASTSRRPQPARPPARARPAGQAGRRGPGPPASQEAEERAPVQQPRPEAARAPHPPGPQAHGQSWPVLRPGAKELPSRGRAPAACAALTPPSRTLVAVPPAPLQGHLVASHPSAGFQRL